MSPGAMGTAAMAGGPPLAFAAVCGQDQRGIQVDRAVTASTFRLLSSHRCSPASAPRDWTEWKADGNNVGTGIHSGRSPRAPRGAEWTWGQGALMEDN